MPRIKRVKVHTCGAYSYDDWADSCGNCLAPLSPA